MTVTYQIHYSLQGTLFTNCSYCGEQVASSRYKSHKRYECEFTPRGIARTNRQLKKLRPAQKRSNVFKTLFGGLF